MAKDFTYGISDFQRDARVAIGKYYLKEQKKPESLGDIYNMLQYQDLIAGFFDRDELEKEFLRVLGATDFKEFSNALVIERSEVGGIH